MKPRRQKPNEEIQMEPVEVFSRVKILPAHEVCYSVFLENFANFYGFCHSSYSNMVEFRVIQKSLKISFKDACIKILDSTTLECYPPISIKSDKGLKVRFIKLIYCQNVSV